MGTRSAAWVSVLFLTVVTAFAGAARAAPAALIADVTVVEPNGMTVAERRVEVALGEEGVAIIRKGNRAIDVKLTARPGAKLGCYMVDLSVKDRDIDSTGQFSTKEWNTRSQLCGGLPNTLGPANDTRVRLAVRAKG